MYAEHIILVVSHDHLIDRLMTKLLLPFLQLLRSLDLRMYSPYLLFTHVGSQRNEMAHRKPKLCNNLSGKMGSVVARKGALSNSIGADKV